MPKPNQGQGDSGKSQLFGSGKKFSKDAPQFEALGALDELNTFIGYTRSICGQKEISSILENIQNDIFTCQANLALEPDYKTDYIPEFKKERIKWLEEKILKYEKKLPELKNFILPGGTETASLMHICRAKTRTAERKIVKLSKKEKVDPIVQAYINRLSDVFFIFARYINLKSGRQDTIWKSKS
ncbi:MAG: cob(I)yrinic acid a,c-diamide adenosyltransferase [Candidatus Spechtbacterales bacterium]|nr:cob(I)yrinic acid a,c-diamide adenosyltransferase [Candidatus Spechtbacterales bacterium]